MEILEYDDGMLDEIAQIERSCFTEPWSAELIRDTAHKPYNKFLVAKENEKIIGYGVSMLMYDEGEILNIAVDGEYRRRGIGRALLEALILSLRERGAAKVFLEVRVSNAAAIALYTSFGYETIDLRHNYYRKPTESAYIMRQIL